jgi:HEAT repeat protein
MATETSPSKPGSASKAVSSETDSQNSPARAATNVDKPLPTDKIAAVLAAANTKVQSQQSLYEELQSPFSGRRAAAARELGRLGDVAAAPALIRALTDSDADAARDAATSLGLLGSDTAVEPLISVVVNADGYFHPVVRIAATYSLMQLRDTRAVVPLLDAIKDSIAEASAEAIRAVASLSDPRGLPALLEVVRNQQGFFLATTRRAAIQGLAQIGGEQAVAELRFVAGNQWEDAVVRAAAIEATRDTSSPTATA